MAYDAARRWTAEEFLALPEDDRRLELLDGQIVVTPPPVVRHQGVATLLGVSLFPFVAPFGGRVFSAPVGVAVDRVNVLQPDFVLLLPEHLDRVGLKLVEGPPDLVAEISSPSTRGRDRLFKRALYERFGVAEYWIVDLDHHLIEVYRLGESGYGEPVRFGRGDMITTPLLPEWSAEVDWLLASV